MANLQNYGVIFSEINNLYLCFKTERVARKAPKPAPRIPEAQSPKRRAPPTPMTTKVCLDHMAIFDCL